LQWTDNKPLHTLVILIVTGLPGSKRI